MDENPYKSPDSTPSDCRQSQSIGRVAIRGAAIGATLLGSLLACGAFVVHVVNDRPITDWNNFILALVSWPLLGGAIGASLAAFFRWFADLV